MRYVVTQYDPWPEAVAGTVNAASLEEATEYARAMWEFVVVVEWSRASRKDRTEALRQDQLAEARSLSGLR